MNFVINFRKQAFKTPETFRAALRLFVALTALFCLNLPNFAQTCMEKKAKIEVQAVETVVDSILEKGISSQIFEMAKSAFSKLPPSQGSGEYTIAINLSERSFYKNVESVRTLYTHYQLFSKSGECVLENVFCSESKNSIISTLVQQKQIERIARDIKKYLASGNFDEA